MEFNLNSAKPALLIVDVQALFSSPDGPFKNTQAGPMVEHINQLSRACRQRQIPVLFSSYMIEDDLSDAGLMLETPVVQGGHLSKNSQWIGLDDRLNIEDSDSQLNRNRPSAFWGGGLDKVLQKLDIDTLLLCGLSVNNAISTTARDGFARDLQVLIPKESTGAAQWETHLDIYFETLHTWTAEVTQQDALIKRLNA